MAIAEKKIIVKQNFSRNLLKIMRFFTINVSKQPALKIELRKVNKANREVFEKKINL